MDKTILFVNDTYCQTVDQLRNMMSDPQLIKSDSFRQEMLSVYRDGVLERWYSERGQEFNVVDDQIRDDILFSSIYSSIVSGEECPNFHSEFSKIGGFDRCEINGEKYQSENGVINLGAISGKQDVRFIFKSTKADNNVRTFSVRHKDEIISSIELNWNDKTRGKECFFDLLLDFSKFQGEKLILLEGEDDVLCSIKCMNPESKTIIIGGEEKTLYYSKSLDCWIVKIFSNPEPYKRLIAYRDKYSAYKFSLLGRNDIKKLMQEDKVWKRFNRGYFWINDYGFCDSSDGQIHVVNNYSKDTERHHCWLKIKNIPIELESNK